MRETFARHKYMILLPMLGFSAGLGIETFDYYYKELHYLYKFWETISFIWAFHGTWVGLLIGYYKDQQIDRQRDLKNIVDAIEAKKKPHSG